MQRIVIWILILGRAIAQVQPSVETNIGTIIGISKTIDVFGEPKMVENYFGIPYAEPPVGELRFRNALPKQRLTSPLNATKHGKACYEMELLPYKPLERSEDCLFLNVYAPANNLGGLAVMIFFHGGALVHGASDYYVSNTLAAFGNVIVVTFNYRLSIFGFLTTEDKFSRGSYAISDQHQAIRWVHENIQSFGGNPDQITLFGQSAGGNSIGLQSLYEGNVGLFKRAIFQSGATIPKPFDFSFVEPKKDAQKLAKIVGCNNTESSQLLIKCLRQIPAEELYSALNNFDNGFFAHYPLPFIVSTIDGEFIKSEPLDSLNIDSPGRRFFSSIDVMIGLNSNEGCFFVGPSFGVQDPENFTPNRTFYENILVPRALEIRFGGAYISKLVEDLILQVYTNWDDPYAALLIRQNFINLYTDIIFAENILNVTKQHSVLETHNSKTYLYEFDVLNSPKPLPSPSWCNRGTHGDEMHFQFFEENGGLITFIPGFEGYVPEEWEKEMAKAIMTIWTNFAKTGNPNEPEPIPTYWPPYTVENEDYLHITREFNADSMKKYLIADRYNLWNKVIPEALQVQGKTMKK